MGEEKGELADLDDILQRFRASGDVEIATSNLEDHMKFTRGFAMLCKIPQVLRNHAEAIREANLIREGLEHLGRPRDQEMQQLVDSFTKYISEILVEDCGCATKSERDVAYYDRASGEFGEIEEMRT